MNVTPRYDQITLNKENRLNKWDTIISPKSVGKGTWIHQNSWFNLSDLQQGCKIQYQTNSPENGIFLMVLKGSIQVLDHTLDQKDAIGITSDKHIEIVALQDSELLLMEIPLNLPSYLGQ